jgi:hypothetical protein
LNTPTERGCRDEKNDTEIVKNRGREGGAWGRFRRRLALVLTAMDSELRDGYDGIFEVFIRSQEV